MKKLTVAITGVFANPGNPASGLGVAKSLSESKGFEGRIIGLDYGVLDPGLNFRKYCDAGYLLPYPTCDDNVILECLKAIHEIEAIEILIPCVDSELPVFNRLAPELQEMGIHCLIPSMVQIQQRNTDKLESFAVEAGFFCPKNNVLLASGFFNQSKKETEHFPTVSDNCIDGESIVDNSGQSTYIFPCVESSNESLIFAQQLFKCKALNLTGVGDGKGGLHGVVMMSKRIVSNKYSVWDGFSTWDHQLLKITEAFVKSISWLGPLGIEVFRDVNGRYFLVEINSCFPTWVYLSHGVGQNLSKLLLGLVGGVPLSGFLLSPQFGV